MHIPDGYLSPSTCAVLYGAAVPFWYAAFARVKRLLHTRLVPRLAVTAAFCFVIMMFNVPLPGGTTGHAVGVGAATVVLGPWAAMLSVSIALLIQAAFFTACELGMQPGLFKDVSGAPLYAPYPLHIAIPAMMIGHLTFAGLAELVVSGGVVSYLQRSNPALLGHSSYGNRQEAASTPSSISAWRPTAPLWIRLALLMLLTPLGILAAGTAWGEWSARDFSNPEMRQKIASASRNVKPPAN